MHLELLVILFYLNYSMWERKIDFYSLQNNSLWVYFLYLCLIKILKWQICSKKGKLSNKKKLTKSPTNSPHCCKCEYITFATSCCNCCNHSNKMWQKLILLQYLHNRHAWTYVLMCTFVKIICTLYASK